MVRKVLFVILLLLMIAIIFYWESVKYGYLQAKGQLTIIFNTVPVEEVLSDATVADSIKNQILVIQEARAFAIENLGLKHTENYTTYYDQKGEVALWNLSAAEPFALQPKLWSFPLLGSFPYKGYFDLELAEAEGKALKEGGYDVRIRPVGGWSTLGWTKDPILSNMLKRSEGRLVELIIHELTHSTLFVADDIEFNENLASFIGERGAIQFLDEKYGKNSEAYFDYIIEEDDSRTFRNQMLLATSQLDSLYMSMSESIPYSIKTQKKHIMIDQIMNSIDTLHFHNPRYYSVFQNTRPNNAFFMSYLRYYSAEDSLKDLLNTRYDKDLKRFIKGMIEYHDN